LLKFEYLQGINNNSTTANRKFKLKPIKKLKIKNKNPVGVSNVDASKDMQSQKCVADSSVNVEDKKDFGIDLYSPRQKFEEEEDHIKEDA
jgi:hypothetical protein